MNKGKLMKRGSKLLSGDLGETVYYDMHPAMPDTVADNVYNKDGEYIGGSIEIQESPSQEYSAISPHPTTPWHMIAGLLAFVFVIIVLLLV